VNPTRVKAPAAQPVSKTNLADFNIQAENLMARLNDTAGVKTASAQPAVSPSAQ
jgi:hypothetical protein